MLIIAHPFFCGHMKIVVALVVKIVKVLQNMNVKIFKLA